MKFEKALKTASEKMSSTTKKEASKSIANEKSKSVKDKSKHDTGLTGEKTGFTGNDGDADDLAKRVKNWNPVK